MTFAETPINEAGFRRQAAVLCRRILLILSAAITVVFLAGSVFIVTNALETRNAILRSITAQALTISNAFDREVTAAQYLLRGLSQSPALLSRDLPGFHAQLMRTPGPAGSSFALWDTQDQVLNTLRPFGTRLPARGDTAGLEDEHKRIARLGFSVSNRIEGPVPGLPLVAASLRLDGADEGMSGVLSVVLPQARLDAVTRDAGGPPGSVTVLMDRLGTVVAASVADPPALSPFPAAVTGLLDGLPSDWSLMFRDSAGERLVGVQHSSITGYITATSMPHVLVNAPVRAAAWQIAAVGAALVLAGSLAGLVATRQVGRVASAAASTARQLDQKSARYASLWNDTPEGLFVVTITPDGRFVYEDINPAHERATGLAHEAVVGKEPVDCLPPDVAAAVTERYRACVTRGVPAVHDEILDLPVGRRHWQTSLVPVRDPETGRIGALVGIARDMTDIANARQDVREIATRLLSLQDEERRRIASDLHDATGQHIIAAELALMLIENAAGDRPGVRDTVTDMRVSLAEAQKEIRTLSYLLYPPQLRAKGFEATLRDFVEGFTHRTGLQARMRISGEVEALPIEIQGMVLRVVQEALVNVHRHAEARSVTVILQCGAGDLGLHIADDGKGLRTRNSESTVLGVGILGMEARIRQFGGVMTISGNRRGTTIRANVPLGGSNMTGCAARAV